MIQVTPKTSTVSASDLSIVRDIFGDDFDIWVNDGQWCCESGPLRRGSSASCVDDAVIAAHVGQVFRGTQSKFQTLDDGRILCLLAISGHSRQAVAVRILPAHSPELLRIAERGAGAAAAGYQQQESIRRRLYEAESQRTAFSRRIAQGHSELSWLQELTTHAELSETQNDPIHAARKILPDMCQILSARTVMFISEPAGLQVDEIPLNAWQTGPTKVPGRICLELIRRHGRSALTQAVVINYSEPQHRQADYSGVLSVIVRAVSRRGVLSGWILAINRDAMPSAGRTGPGHVRRTSAYSEFGDFECSLVDAAASALATHAGNSRLLKEKEALISGVIRSLVNAIDAKDHYTCGHSDRVAAYARQIASTMKMGDEFCEQIYMTGLLHDVGKIGVPDDVLQKPGRLTDAEFDQIKLHPVIGHRILQHLSDFAYVLPGVLHHHEAVDGSGYPSGLRGEEIPLDARILAVADAYDAMTSDRPYRDGMSGERAAAIIADGAGKQWDRDCVSAFQKCFDGIRLIAHEGHHGTVRRPGTAVRASQSATGLRHTQ